MWGYVGLSFGSSITVELFFGSKIAISNVYAETGISSVANYFLIKSIS